MINKKLGQEQATHLVSITQTRVREISTNIKNMKQIMCTDQTGRFPVVSSQGNRFIMVFCKTDRNLILVESMKNRTSGEM